MSQVFTHLHRPILPIRASSNEIRFVMAQPSYGPHVFAVRRQTSNDPEECDWHEVQYHELSGHEVSLSITETMREMCTGVYEAALFRGDCPGTGQCWRDQLCFTAFLDTPRHRLISMEQSYVATCFGGPNLEIPKALCGVVNFSTVLSTAIIAGETLIRIPQKQIELATPPVKGSIFLTLRKSGGIMEDVRVVGKASDRLVVERDNPSFSFPTGSILEFTWNQNNLDLAEALLEAERQDCLGNEGAGCGEI